MSREDYEKLKLIQEEGDVVYFEQGGVPLEFNLKEIAVALGRVNEVVYASKSTAQVLSGAYNESMSAILQVINRASCVRDAARHETKRVHGRLMLDFAGPELERRGLKDTQAHREAAVLLHDEYVEAQEKESYLAWVVKDLEAKHRRIYDANKTALAIMGDREYHRGGISGGGPAAPVGQGQSHPGPEPMFGNAKY